jgi:hypothetical protein
MKWQIAEEYLEEYIAKVHRNMSPRSKQKVPSLSNANTPEQRSPLQSRYSGSSHVEGTPVRGPASSDYMSSPPTSLRHSSAAPPSLGTPGVSEMLTPERTSVQRQYMPMSSPAPFYRYSTINTPTTAHDHSSPPSSGALDLAETLMEFSSPTKHREPQHRLSSSSEQDESPSRPSRNGIKPSLGDLQGVDLLRGFEKISSWREGNSPIKEGKNEDGGFGMELKRMVKEYEGVNGNGVVEDCVNRTITPPDSQMTEVKGEMERVVDN